MLTKVNENILEKNDLKTNHFFSIPENIKNQIKERWFYMYNWIWNKDVKLSIQRDFLKFIKKFWTILAVLLILPSAILYFTWWILFTLYFFWFLSVINIFFLIYLFTISISRSSILRKNAYVLLTNSHISINWDIEKLENYDLKKYEKLKQISNLFEEELFKESNIEKTKKWFLTNIFDQIWNWFKFIFRMWKWNSRNSWQIILILLWLYLVYIVSLWIIYFVWILFIWLFWILLTIINKQILLISGHQITKISDKFEEIDYSSNKLLEEKDRLSKYLFDAMNNDWKDSLLIKINDWISSINKNASSAVSTSIELKKDIKESKYSEMFDFWVYNDWIKKQIYIPINQIKDLLEKNLEILKTQKANIELQILQTEDNSLKWPLILSKDRIIMNIEQIEKHIISMWVYLDKLK